MIKLIGQKWTSFRQIVNNWLLTMDTEPLEDIRRRVRRLEAVISQLEVGRRPTRSDHIEGDFGEQALAPSGALRQRFTPTVRSMNGENCEFPQSEGSPWPPAL